VKPRRLVLASASPRRAEILRSHGFEFTVVETKTDESERHGEAPAAHVERLAREKAVRGSRMREGRSGACVGADTAVVIGRRILGKPASPQDARRMLRLLSGRTHRVLTGVAVYRPSTRRLVSGVGVTRVRFRKISEEEIGEYVHTGEPMDKAGAYAIQGGAGNFVDSIDGAYDNVVGFPMDLFLRLLSAAS